MSLEFSIFEEEGVESLQITYKNKGATFTSYILLEKYRLVVNQLAALIEVPEWNFVDCGRLTTFKIEATPHEMTVKFIVNTADKAHTHTFEGIVDRAPETLRKMSDNLKRLCL